MKDKQLQKMALMVDHLASCSHNIKMKVGCLILKNGRIVSSGYNGTLPGDENIIEPGTGNAAKTVHAEQNALMNCCANGIATMGCVMVVSHYPCSECTKLAVMAGIKKIYFVRNYKNTWNLFEHRIEMEKIS